MANILVIESDSSLRALYGAKLSDLGHSVTLVEDGKEGIVQARKLIPDLIMLDLELEDMEGLIVLKDLHINKKTGPVPVIVSSYDDDEVTIKSVFDLGAIDFISREKTTANEYIGKVDAAIKDLISKGLVKDATQPVSGVKVTDITKERRKKELEQKVKKFTAKLIKESKGVDPAVVAKEVRETIESEIKIKELTDLGIPRAQAESLFALAGTAKKVLIVSDDEFFGRTYRLKLAAAGFNSFETYDQESLDLILSRISPDMAVIDVKYPKELITILDEEGTPFIYMSDNKKECGSNKSCFVRAETTPAAVLAAIRRKIGQG